MNNIRKVTETRMSRDIHGIKGNWYNLNEDCILFTGLWFITVTDLLAYPITSLYSGSLIADSYGPLYQSALSTGINVIIRMPTV